MVTLGTILESDMGCYKAFNGDGSLSFEGTEAVEKIIELLKDLASCGIIPDVAAQAEKQFAEIMKKPRSQKEQMIVELHEFVTSGCKTYVLDTPVMVKTENGYDLLAKYFSRDTDYKDLFCADMDVDNDDATVYDMHDLSDESVRKIYESIKSQEIENGWDWREHAIAFLKKTHPEIENEEFIFDFVGEYWMNLATDAKNLTEFEATL